MLHSRLRPLPRPHRPQPPPPPCSTYRSLSQIPSPDLLDEDVAAEDESPEDLFGAFLHHLFPDDAPSFHGDPGQCLLYASPRYGDLEIMVPSYPEERKRTKASESESESQKPSDQSSRPTSEEGHNGGSQVEEGRKLFAHFLWSAALVVAEGVEKAASINTNTATGIERYDGQDAAMWAVQGETVLELGAGAALPSLICALAGTSSVTITDHPASPALTGAISFNIRRNLADTSHPRPPRSSSPPTSLSSISIYPHEWGNLTTDRFAINNKGTFTRIIAADCCWMLSQHENLVRTMLWFLDPDPDRGGRIWVVAGFHTGRAIVRAFFEKAESLGLVVERIYERDLNASSSSARTGNPVGGEEETEVRREWMPVRQGEGVENRTRWCVVAVLKRQEESH